MGRIEDIEHDVLNNGAYLWVGVDDVAIRGAGITTVWCERNRRICSLVAACGDWKRCGHLLGAIEQCADGATLAFP
jgi:hypothetical protein